MSSTRGFSRAFHAFDSRVPSTSSYRHDSHRWTSRDLKDALAVSNLASSDQPVPSIEPSDPSHDREFSNETILRIDDRATHHVSSPLNSPRRTSHLTQASTISELPDYDISNTEDAHAPFTPIKDRPVFRNPSSVRAMQMASPPPFDHFSSPRSAQRYKLSTPSRSGTPRSARSQSGMKAKGVSPKPPRKEHPLVLLHVTLLPVVLPYSLESMQAILPPSILENYNLLRDKVSDTVLQRGILIPHPGEDYELLEERLLEALELKTPRILKCGHFHLSCSRPSGSGMRSDTLRNGYEDAGSSSSSHSRHSSSSHCSPPSDDEGEDIDPAERCTDCGRRIKEPRFGLGQGNRRYEVRIYASNGLMRAGAWAAAWKEMERVDVEIGVWMPEGVRREMDDWRAREEDEIRKAMVEEEVERMRGAEATGLDREYAGRVSPRPQLGKYARPIGKELDEGMEEAKRMFESHMEHEKEQSRPPRRTTKPESQVPLTTLLRNYIYLLAQDRRNIAIFVLTVSLLFLAFRPTIPSSFLESSVSPAIVDSDLVPDALLELVPDPILPDAEVQSRTTESITGTQTVYQTHTHTLTVSETAPASPAPTVSTVPSFSAVSAADTQETESVLAALSLPTSPSDPSMSATQEVDIPCEDEEQESRATSLPQPSALMAAVMPDAFPESRAEET